MYIRVTHCHPRPWPPSRSSAPCPPPRRMEDVPGCKYLREAGKRKSREGERPFALFPSPFADDDDDNAWLRARGREGGVCHVARRPHHPHKSRGPRSRGGGGHGTNGLRCNTRHGGGGGGGGGGEYGVLQSVRVQKWG